MRTFILSDLHLGSRNCDAPQILKLLDQGSFDRLILNGDTINSVNLRKFSPDHWAIIEKLRKLARGRELILIRGNHDHDFDHDPYRPSPSPLNGNGRVCVASNGTALESGHANGTLTLTSAPGTIQVLPALLEVPMVEEYELDVGGQPYLVLHGDRFDPTLNYPLVTEVAGWCYQVSQKVNKKLAKWLKKKSKKWGGVLEWVRCQSIAHIKGRQLSGVITGHTHFAEDSQIEDIHYVNTGCWTEPPCTYVSVENGQLHLHHLPE